MQGGSCVLRMPMEFQGVVMRCMFAQMLNTYLDVFRVSHACGAVSIFIVEDSGLRAKPCP